MLLRLPYLAVSSLFAFMRLLPMSAVDKDIEILTLCHQLAVLQRQIDRPCIIPKDRVVWEPPWHLASRRSTPELDTGGVTSGKLTNPAPPTNLSLPLLGRITTRRRGWTPYSVSARTFSPRRPRRPAKPSVPIASPQSVVPQLGEAFAVPGVPRVIGADLGDQSGERLGRPGALFSGRGIPSPAVSIDRG
ncbi:hypothetical protein ACH4S8_26430 [Streptomyces sp. NPDC021080]|uniref:hypothetical protein n=1 Tax=Streptomyces sp. NPDC021080 TaxID=3365110 RepID=UPI00379DD475